ncbi:hypothetical protein ACPOL_6769 (plasmid) [Acidisarcina polymorpha]|uniref:Uncharacterized protein n=1 Tax=Acidisarcina polymorpha TaxID=2211140 RepID=A0A2Z5GAD8_9BACT|nr:hypothetical protein [Acidisarcina polymorpha]AXC15979.1 hypothetical protein ACPOL_6769 [Acidisarcina polymorpha]
MLKAIDTKLLIAILAALSIISAAIFRIEKQHTDQARREAEIRKQDEDFRKQVETLKKKSHASAGNEGDTWKKYY